MQILMDPWGCEIADSTIVSEFEDDFKPEKSDKLADSAEYLAILGNDIVLYIFIAIIYLDIRLSEVILHNKMFI